MYIQRTFSYKTDTYILNILNISGDRISSAKYVHISFVPFSVTGCQTNTDAGTTRPPTHGIAENDGTG